jgi:hypothetical protein
MSLAQWTRIHTNGWRKRGRVLDCAGKRSATALFDRAASCESGVALRLPPQSK